MSSQSKPPGKNGALVVSPRQAQIMLDVGNTLFYRLLRESDELISYKDGRSRKIVVASIQAYVDRRVAASRAENKAPAVPDHGESV
jgi:hypothetical protein